MPSHVPFGPQQGQTYGLLIGVAIALVVMLVRNSRARALKIERMWIRPAIFLALLGLMLWGAPPPLTVVSVAIMAAALAVGAALGWQRGRLMRIEVHPQTHELTSQPSPLGMIFIVAVMGLRIFLRASPAANASFLHLPVTAMTDATFMLLVGMMIAQNGEMALRARRLLAEAQAAKATVAVDDPSQGPPSLTP